MRVLVFCGLLALALGTAHGANVSPVQKVIELLDDLKGKVASDLAAEEAEMGEFTKFCENEASEKGYAIRTAKKKVEDLQARIDDASAQHEAAESEIAELSSAVAKKETELANSVKLRESERGEFKHTESDLVNAEDELLKAEQVIKREMSFVQTQGQHKPQEKMSLKGVRELTTALSKVLDATWVNMHSKSALKGFLQQQTGEQDQDKELSMTPLGAPEAENYENHSGGIVETVKELEVKDEEQLSSTRKQEMENQHAFSMMKMSMEDAINVLKKKISKDTQKKAGLEQKIGAANGEMAEVQKAQAADEEYLTNLNTDCAAKASQWEVRQKDAADEMAAIEKAKEILATGVKVFVQTGAKSHKGDDEDETRAKVQKALQTLGHKFNSYAMMEMASAAAADPFEKVRGLIEDMIAKLMDAAAQEADHKAFCDEELGKSRKAKDEKSMRMDQYRTRIDEAATTKAELEEAVKELEAEIAEIDAAQAEASKIRTAEHETYLKASSDFKQSAEAVEKAMAVLSEYYGKGAALIQVRVHKQPDFGSKTGSDTASTILSILEVSASDFTKLLAECEAAEEEASAAFTKLSDENRVAKAAKQAEVQGKTSEAKSLKVALTHHNEDYRSVSKEYDAVLAYLDKLKPECETKVMTYAEKKARREQEIEGLKEALAIIEGRSVPSVELVQTKTAPDMSEEVKKEFAQNIQIHDTFSNMEDDDVKKEKQVKADKDLSALQK